MTTIMRKIDQRIRRRMAAIPPEQQWKAVRAMASLQAMKQPAFFQSEAIQQGVAEDLDALTGELMKLPRSGKECPKCSNRGVFGKVGERVCTACGAFEHANPDITSTSRSKR